MKYAPKVFGRLAFRKYSRPNENRRPINRGLFETESVVLGWRTTQELDVLSLRSESVIDRFGEYFERDNAFREALLYATGKGVASNKRIEIMDKLISEVLSD